MNITCKFEAVITTEKSYPFSFNVTFKCEVTTADMDAIMKKGWDYLDENLPVSGMVAASLECKGCTFIHDAMLDELKKLDSQGLKRINGNRLSRLF